ncbi:hypothetical protein QF028_004656 [Neobacillus sp. B4I6]|uniref:hypothetical protein n=1 Tax=Neobacillus sp. B4I6 TaxID=3373925 RepID=UPI003D23B0A9
MSIVRAPKDKTPQGKGKMSIIEAPKDKTPQGKGKMSIIEAPKDKTPQGKRKNVYRKGSEGQNSTREKEKCLS